MWKQGYEEIVEYAKKQEIEILGEIPMDMTIPKAIVQGLPVVVFNNECSASRALRQITNNLLKIFMEVV